MEHLVRGQTYALSFGAEAQVPALKRWLFEFKEMACEGVLRI
jgi:hypothetical protein